MQKRRGFIKQKKRPARPDTIAYSLIVADFCAQVKRCYRHVFFNKSSTAQSGNHKIIDPANPTSSSFQWTNQV